MNNGYIQIEINGEKVGLKFGLPAIRSIAQYQDVEGFYSDDKKTVYSEIGIAQIIYSGYCCNQRIKSEPVTLTMNEIYDFVEERALNVERFGSEVMPIIDCLNNSRVVEELAKNAKEEESKKKPLAVGTKSKAIAMAS